MTSPLSKDVDIERLLRKLAFPQEETEQAAVEQPRLFMDAATYRVHKMRERQQAEMHEENLRVDYSLKMRAKFKGQKGTTEKALAEMVNKNPDLRDAVAAVAKTKRLEEWSKLLLDAYEHRRSSIKILAQFAFMKDTFSGQSEVDRMKRKKEFLKRSREMEE